MRKLEEILAPLARDMVQIWFKSSPRLIILGSLSGKKILLIFSLRQHYLGQVQRVDDALVVLSAGSSQLPFPLNPTEL